MVLPGYVSHLSSLLMLGTWLVSYRIIDKWAQRAIMSDQTVSRSRILLVFFTLFLLSLGASTYMYFLGSVLNWFYFMMSFSVLNFVPIYALLKRKPINETHEIV